MIIIIIIIIIIKIIIIIMITTATTTTKSNILQLFPFLLIKTRLYHIEGSPGSEKTGDAVKSPEMIVSLLFEIPEAKLS